MQKNYFRPKRRSFGSYRGGSGRFQNSGRNHGRRTVKGFDISLLTRKAQVSAPAVEYVPKNQFSDFDIVQKLKDVIRARGYVTPTPIQDQAIPELLKGRDVVGIANTGTGKTAAFLIPLINKVAKDKSQKVLIVAPTRELAIQIQTECFAFTKGMGIYSTVCIGGVNIGSQIFALKRNPNIVIGTPGRLKDLHERKSIHFSQYKSIVLDEVDTMLDMGFINDVKYIVASLPTPRQSLFFSATMTPAITAVMKSFLNDPLTISVKSGETAANVDQDIIQTEGREKLDVLHDLLIKEEFKKVLIFGRTKRGVQKLAGLLTAKGHRVAALHGDKSQGQRKIALSQFRDNRVRILLATDVASRGLDISDITHVINYELPETYADYVHRIGRTGRANKKGIALSFLR